MAKAQIETGLGHEVCTWGDSGPPRPDISDPGMLLGIQPISYSPNNWQKVMELQREIMSQMPPDALIWNEIVLGLPHQLKDVVSAVIYWEESDEDYEAVLDRARKQAHAFSNVPVLKVNYADPFAANPLFVCDDQQQDHNRHVEDTVIHKPSNINWHPKERVPLLLRQGGFGRQWRKCLLILFLYVRCYICS